MKNLRKIYKKYMIRPIIYKVFPRIIIGMLSQDCGIDLSMPTNGATCWGMLLCWWAFSLWHWRGLAS